MGYMKTYYHVTRKKNLTSILNNGLYPKIGDLSKLCDETENKIYLFPSIDDMENALMNWLGENLIELYGEDEPCCSLKITVPDNFPIVEGDVDYEVYSYHHIDKKYITYLKDE